MTQTTANPTHLEQWQEDGYVVLRGAVDLDRVARLREASDAALERWTRESRAEVEPFEYAYAPDAWLLVHLNHPRHHGLVSGSLPLLLGTMADPSLLAVVRELMRDQPAMTNANYYINPPQKTRVSIWHRDCQFFAPGDEAFELKQFNDEMDPPREFHMHIPLVPTRATEVVPGSHRQWDTPEQLRVRRHDSTSDHMPGGIALELQPGDVGFFHVNAIHRGVYKTSIPRRTIAVTWSNLKRRRRITREWLTNWKGYAAPCQPWFLWPGYLDGLEPETRAFYETQIRDMRAEWEQPGLFDDLSPQRRAYFMQPEESIV